MKKWLMVIAVLTTMMMILTAVGCGDKESDPSPTQAPTATPEPTSQPTEAPTPTAVPTATPVPTPSPVPDPDVDAMLIRFHDLNRFAWDVEIVTENTTGNQVMVAYDEEKGALAVYPMGQDPYFSIVPMSDNMDEIDLQTYPVFKIRMWNNTPSTIFEMFLSTNSDIVAANVFQKTGISAMDTGWVEYIVDLKAEKGASYCNGVLANIRMDVVNLDAHIAAIEERAGEEYYAVFIDYMGFFKTVEDAQNWNPAHVTNG